MLSRRQLRIKVLQSLYSFLQSGKNDLAAGERELFRSIDQVYELYLFLLLLLKELGDADLQDAEDLLHKNFPEENELKAKKRLHQSGFIAALFADATFTAEIKNRKLSWQKDHELVRRLFHEIKKSKAYRNYFVQSEITEKDILDTIVQDFFEKSENLQHYIEENNIYWSEDFSFVCHLVMKTIKDFYHSGKLEITPVFKDEDDRTFVRELFSKTILNNMEYEEAIAAKTKNWEVERIALMDMILLKMALSEMVSFPGIPVKVSINEYIDISKDYSTPKSRQFINGIIDKLADEYSKAGKIVKTGRGLVG
ncbi:MAG: transcription antitermination factor NusB [Bacteroidetes bacterium]|nr:transcription antitermination factor NusB [Bacteroidota bacterium]